MTFRPQGEQRCEIAVRRNDNPPLGGRPRQDIDIRSRGHPVIPNMHGIVAGRAQTLGDNRRQGVVDEKFQRWC